MERFSFFGMEAPPQSIITRSAPRSTSATMMAAFKLADAFTYFLLGWLGRFYEPPGLARYWSLTAVLPLAGLVLLLLTPGGRLRACWTPAAADAAGVLRRW